MTEPWFTIWTFIVTMAGFVGGMALVAGLGIGILVLTNLPDLWRRWRRLQRRD
jgi:hypothetical protein